MSKTQKQSDEILTTQRMSDVEQAIEGAVASNVLSIEEATLMRKQLKSVVGLTGLQLMLFFTGAFILMSPNMAFAVYETLKEVMKTKLTEAFEEHLFEKSSLENMDPNFEKNEE